MSCYTSTLSLVALWQNKTNNMSLIEYINEKKGKTSKDEDFIRLSKEENKKVGDKADPLLDAISEEIAKFIENSPETLEELIQPVLVALSSNLIKVLSVIEDYAEKNGIDVEKAFEKEDRIYSVEANNKIVEIRRVKD